MKKGQALIMLLVFIIIGITVTSAAVAIMIINSTSAQKAESGTVAFQIAESGIENALLRLLRDPTYTGETNLPIGDGSSSISVIGSNPYTITATGVNGNFTRKLEAVVNYNGIMNITSWREIY
ncbi:hypothetical protein HY357_04550 [Candidatus Roizmanbacteria bacterium]|nr:hypothetical protein [Candidatus Roizmanbacteria bacterium]